MITKFIKYNESIRDKMSPKSDEELDGVWDTLSKKLISGVIAWHDDIDNEKDALDYIEKYKDVIIDLRKEGWDDNILAHEIVFKEFITEKFKIGSYEEFMKNKGTDENEFGADVGDKEIDGKVTDLIKFAYDKEYPIVNFDMKDLYKISGWKSTEEDKKYWSGYDEETKKFTPYFDMSKKEQEKMDKKVEGDIDKSDIDYPIIVTVDKNNKPIAILDGNHRVEKAHRLKRKKLKGIAIPKEDILKKFKKK